MCPWLSNAAAHGDVFDRVDAVAQVEGRLLALNIRSEPVRGAIAKLKEGKIKALIKRHGANFSSWFGFASEAGIL